jgi:predicted nucleotidyltransferase
MSGREEAHCYRCGHVWLPRGRRVRICARCKSPYFWLPKIHVPTYGGGEGIDSVIGRKRDRVLRIASRYGVTNVRVFGSVSRKQATAHSDVDLLVDRIPGRRIKWIDLALDLRRELGRPVEIVAEDNLFWLVQPRVISEAVPL